MEGSIREVLDTRGARKCVRFETGQVGVVNSRGQTEIMVGAFQELEFAPNGFLRACNGREFFVDMKNGAFYARMPELVRFGHFEMAYIGGHLCTRTKKLYEVRAFPAEAWHGKSGLYLSLPYRGEPEESIRKKMPVTPSRYEVCLLDGDESGVYWLLRVFEDDSLLVMDNAGNCYHAKRSARAGKAVKVMDNAGNCYHAKRGARAGKAVKVWLGKVENDVDRAMIVHAVREIEAQMADNLKRLAAKVKRQAEKERERLMAALVPAEPFCIGHKWGLRKRGRIVVPPVFRNLKSPVGRYCAIETCPGMWGVMAVDGKMEVEARYEDVHIHTDGTVDLTIRQGKVIRKKLP